jgi:MFS family permease
MRCMSCAGSASRGEPQAWGRCVVSSGPGRTLADEAAERAEALWSPLRPLFPPSASADAGWLVSAYTLRSFADGFVSVVLASYLLGLGFSALQVGAIVTGTLLGSAVLTLSVGLFGGGLPRRTVFLTACALMFITGLGFFSVTAFWPLLLIAVVGTLNPSAGDMSVFLPTEQAMLPETVADRERTALFARYNLGGRFAGALGALASGVPALIAQQEGWDLTAAQRAGFLMYACVAVLTALIYTRVSMARETRSAGGRPTPLRQARRIVLKLTALFTLDSAGGGLVVQSLLALWLFKRFDLSIEVVAAIFFVSGLFSACSQLVSSRLAARIGLVNTMVFTHLPSNGLLILAALMPSAPLAIGCLLARMLLSQMDVPARQSYVMAVVPREERAAAASVTNVPRSLGAALTPLLAGWLLSRTAFGWPLILAGLAKTAYDLLLLVQFRTIKPPEERRS